MDKYLGNDDGKMRQKGRGRRDLLIIFDCLFKVLYLLNFVCIIYDTSVIMFILWPSKWTGTGIAAILDNYKSNGFLK